MHQARTLHPKAGPRDTRMQPNKKQAQESTGNKTAAAVSRHMALCKIDRMFFFQLIFFSFTFTLMNLLINFCFKPKRTAEFNKFHELFPFKKAVWLSKGVGGRMGKLTIQLPLGMSTFSVAKGKVP